MADLLENYLQDSEGAGKVLVHARLLIRLAGLYAEIAPTHLARASRVANFKSGVVVIHADSGAIAAKLRQMAPTLVDQLAQRGIECSGVQVKVQARDQREPARAPAHKPLSVRTSAELTALSSSLPTSPLRRALEGLLARSAREE